MASAQPSRTDLRVAIAGGGTGGHVIPALAIGRELRDRHHANLLYIGTSRGLETKLVPAAGFPLELVRSGQLKNVSLKTRLKTMTALPHGVLRCLHLLRSFRPQVVVGVGGYASGPAILAAALLRIPTLAYEPNAVPGLTNRIAGRFTSAAAVNFPQTTTFFRHAEVTGVPVRPEIFDTPAKNASPAPSAPLRLLVTAGSQGAAIFNDLMPRIAHRLLRDLPTLSIVHQAGPRHLEVTRSAYATTLGSTDLAADRVQVEAFLNDMPAQYAAADLVLARSGSTVAELCAAGRASILIPFPQAADDHQRKNAEVLAQAGAALMLLQADTTEHTLREALVSLFTDDACRATMAANARALARPGALQRIADMVLELAGSS